jgi:FecR protein
MAQRSIQLAKNPALLFLVGLVLAIALSLYKGGSPVKPFEHEFLPPESIGLISEIRERPVWVKFLNSRSETSATLNTAIAPGETVKTENDALVEVVLKNGATVRLAGDGVVGFKTDNQLSLQRGKILVKVPANSKIPKIEIQVQMRQAIASILSGTVFLEVPNIPLMPLQLISLDGAAKIKLNQVDQPIELKAGQKLNISLLGRAEKPNLIAQVDLEKYFAKERLLEASQPQFPARNLPEYTQIKPETDSVKVTSNSNYYKDEYIEQYREPSYQPKASSESAKRPAKPESPSAPAITSPQPSVAENKPFFPSQSVDPEPRTISEPVPVEAPIEATEPKVIPLPESANP